MPFIPPTVGRVVYYYDAGQLVPRAAIIAYVVNTNTVNLMIISTSGNPFSATDVPLIQGDSLANRINCAYCTWMPYQLGQAQRTQQAEALGTGEKLNRNLVNGAGPPSNDGETAFIANTETRDTAPVIDQAANPVARMDDDGAPPPPVDANKVPQL